MIWNNRRAWAEMSGTLYRPLDENFVRGLAFILTEEMDNCAEDYRQTDQHAIAAMENEEYVVPSAYSLPDRMRDYYQYLQKPDEHPLIKAAVAQAYLLVTRPFPEGNERLSRMMSSAVLLRCGYDFFRDISISSVIARESYLYYKCMCEIIRSENGGDLTYFLQYYLELLARSLDARDERLRRLEQEALDREREKLQQEEALARQPLRQTATEAAASGPGDAESNHEEGTAEESPSNEDPHREALPVKSQDEPHHTEHPLMDPAEFLEAIGSLRKVKPWIIHKHQEQFRKVMQAGMTVFSAGEWAKLHGLTSKRAQNDLRLWCSKGWVKKEMINGRYIYTLMVTRTTAHSAATEAQGGNDTCLPPVSASEPKDELNVEIPSEVHPPGNDSFERALEKMDFSRYEHIRLIASTVREMLAKGVTTFTTDDWKELLGINPKRARDDCYYMRQSGIIQPISLNTRPIKYGFIGSCAVPFKGGENCGRPSEEMIAELKEIESDHDKEHARKMATILLQLIDKGKYEFTEEEVAEAYGLPQSTCNNLLRRCVNLGFLHRIPLRNGKGNCRYSFLHDKEVGIRGNGLTRLQKTILTALYDEFGEGGFTLYNAAAYIGQKSNSLSFHIQSFAQRGILQVENGRGGAILYTFATTPEEHPECFSDELMKRRERVASTAFLSQIAYSPGA